MSGPPTLQPHVRAVGAGTEQLIDLNLRRWAVYPLVWCPHCRAERPCAGPYCQCCGTDVEET